MSTESEPSSFEQLVQTPASHCPLAQSAAAAQAPPSVQPSQTGPPQSTAVSRPFLIPSEQLMQTVCVSSQPTGPNPSHMPLSQSPSAVY